MTARERERERERPTRGDKKKRERERGREREEEREGRETSRRGEGDIWVEWLWESGRLECLVRLQRAVAGATLGHRVGHSKVDTDDETGRGGMRRGVCPRGGACECEEQVRSGEARV